MASRLKCWEFFKCGEKECPVYQSKEIRCWLVSGTHCRNEIQGKFLEKIEMCLDCEPFKANMDNDSVEETLRVVHAQFREFGRIVEQRDRELETTSMELAMGLSEVMEALRRIASGDPEVRISEDSNLELIAKLKHMVNLTAENLGEIVGMSHDFAIGLAEHFDTLHRVSIGDLTARVLGVTEVELLESFKEVTNKMIENVSKEMSERQAAQEAALKEKNFSESAISSLPGIFYLFDKKGRFLRWNENFERVSGYSAEEISSMVPLDFFGGEDRELAAKAIQEAFDKGKTAVEAELLSADGRKTPYYFTGMRAKIGDETYLVGMGIDISERKIAEAALDSERRQLLSMFDGMDEVIYVADPRTYEMLYMNGPAKEQWGDGVGRKCHKVLQNLDSPCPFCTNDRIFGENAGMPYVWEFQNTANRRWYRCLDRAISWPDGRLVRFEMAIDITEQREAQAELLRITKAVESSSDAISMADAEGVHFYQNGAFTELFGYELVELIAAEGPPWLYADEDLAREVLQEIMAGRSWMGEIQMLSKDQRKIPVLLRADAVKNRAGEIIGLIRMYTDITERKKAEEELTRAKEDAEAANVAKSEFLANMSHEIRTPMNAIIGMTDLALDTDLTTEQSEYLQTVKASSDSLLTLINDILDLSKIESRKLDLDLVDFNLADNVGDTLKTLAVRADEKGLELACRVLPDVPETLVGDPGRLRQILMNLVGNAIKFTERGEVVVHVERGSDREDRICLHFTVADTGVGIPREKQHLIFEPFAQADGTTTRKYGGTGLGLTITKHLVEMMGGAIEVESKVGKGTSLRFSAYFDPPKRASEGSPAFQSVDVRGLRVLVVDDNATNRRILEEILGNWGMKPTGVNNARAALATMGQAKKLGLPFGLVLLDAVMPGMDGFALAQEMKKRPGLVGIVIMMVTSAGQRGDAARCRELGISAYLTKPIKQSDLLDTIMTVLAYEQGEEGASALITRHTLREMQGARATEGGRTSLKILVAEDNAVNQKVVSRVLEKQGHTVLLAKNGKEAVASLEEEHFDLVLMDVQMPEMDGLEATETIRERESGLSARIPIIALTAHAMKGDRDQCLKAGMDDYVSKPIKPEELFQAIERQVSASNRVGEKGAETGPSGDDKILDWAALLERFDQDENLCHELLGMFLEDTPSQLHSLGQAIEENDPLMVEHCAHAIKGASANIGAHALREAASQMEKAGRDGDMGEVAFFMGKLKGRFEELRKVLSHGGPGQEQQAQSMQ